LKDELDPKIAKWSHKGNQRNNIATLLYKLPDILWAESGWDAIDFSDVQGSENIHKFYKKSLIRLHEDKIITDDPRAKFLSRAITTELKEAYREFKDNEAKQKQ